MIQSRKIPVRFRGRRRRKAGAKSHKSTLSLWGRTVSALQRSKLAKVDRSRFHKTPYISPWVVEFRERRELFTQKVTQKIIGSVVMILASIRKHDNEQRIQASYPDTNHPEPDIFPPFKPTKIPGLTALQDADLLGVMTEKPTQSYLSAQILTPETDLSLKANVAPTAKPYQHQWRPHRTPTTLVCLCASHISRPERIPFFLDTLRSIRLQTVQVPTHILLSTGPDIDKEQLLFEVNRLIEDFPITIHQDESTEKAQFQKYSRLLHALNLEEHTWVSFLDDDDILAPERNEILLAMATRCLEHAFNVPKVVRFTNANNLRHAMDLCRDPVDFSFNEMVEQLRPMSTRLGDCVYWTRVVRAGELSRLLECLPTHEPQCDLSFNEALKGIPNMNPELLKEPHLKLSFVYGYRIHTLGDWKQPHLAKGQVAPTDFLSNFVDEGFIEGPTTSTHIGNTTNYTTTTM